MTNTVSFNDFKLCSDARKMAEVAAKADRKHDDVKKDLPMYAASFADTFVTINKEFFDQRTLGEVVRTSARFAVEFAFWYTHFTKEEHSF